MRIVAAFCLAFTLAVAVAAAPMDDSKSTPATSQADALRVQLRRERVLHRLQLRRLVAVNRRLVRAFIAGPGYVSPRDASWECIHRGEGAWNSETGNGYHGGLQMDSTFERGYGPEFVARWGHASAWPVWAQKIAADRAFVTRGFTPWPNTARACGLL